MINQLPEKWCIKSTRQTAQTIYNWLEQNKQKTTVYNKAISEGDEKSFVQYPVYNNNHQSYHVEEGYTEITFEEFEQYVLKTKPVKTQDYKYLIPILKKYNIK